MALTRYIISPLFSSFSPFSIPSSGDIFRCFFVSPLLYSRSLTIRRDIQLSYCSFAHGAYDDILVRRWLSCIPPGEIMASEQPFWKSSSSFPLHVRAITGERSFKLLFLVLLLNGDPPWFLSQRIIEGKRWASERRRHIARVKNKDTRVIINRAVGLGPWVIDHCAEMRELPITWKMSNKKKLEIQQTILFESDQFIISLINIGRKRWSRSRSFPQNFPVARRFRFPRSAKESNEMQGPRRRAIRLITIQNARAMIFHFFFEALRSDVFNFPPRAPARGPGRMQIVTGKLCATVKLMSFWDRDLIARYVLRVPHTYTRVQFRERIYEVTKSLALAKLNSTCPTSLTRINHQGIDCWYSHLSLQCTVI